MKIKEHCVEIYALYEYYSSDYFRSVREWVWLYDCTSMGLLLFYSILVQYSTVQYYRYFSSRGRAGMQMIVLTTIWLQYK